MFKWLIPSKNTEKVRTSSSNFVDSYDTRFEPHPTGGAGIKRGLQKPFFVDKVGLLT